MKPVPQPFVLVFPPFLDHVVNHLGASGLVEQMGALSRVTRNMCDGASSSFWARVCCELRCPSFLKTSGRTSRWPDAKADEDSSPTMFRDYPIKAPAYDFGKGASFRAEESSGFPSKVQPPRSQKWRRAARHIALSSGGKSSPLLELHDHLKDTVIRILEACCDGSMCGISTTSAESSGASRRPTSESFGTLRFSNPR